jgi:diadenosine tetraphosphate (Ap4A) HIT family hydrolase
MSTEFELHPQLAADTFDVAKLRTSRVLLMNDARFPWLIVVPEVADLRDWHDVPNAMQTTVLEEVNRVSRTLKDQTGADKMNVAALGNQVPQLHIHVIARTETDAAWPKPVWGEGSAEPYTESARAELIAALRSALG